VVGKGCQLAYSHYRAATRLHEALAELDRAEPGWRLHELEAARALVPDGENSALCVVAVSRLLPGGWPTQEFAGQFDGLEPPEQLDREEFVTLCRALDDLRPALVEARKLVNRPSGRHRITYHRNFISTLLIDQQKVRLVTQLLLYETLRKGQVGDTKAALMSCRAMLNAARSIGDEPFFISQIVRNVSVRKTCQALERALAQGEAREADLAAMQRALEQEESFPGVQIAVRGERAGWHELFDAVEKGELPLSDLAGPLSPWEERFRGWIIRDTFRAEHPLFLSLMTRWIPELGRPLHEQIAVERAIAAEAHHLSRESALPGLVIPFVATAGETFRRKHADVRCAVVALATERYRLEHGTWPKSLERLTPNLLGHVLLDPFDGQALHYHRLPDGVVIYSVGDDAQDNGGALDREDSHHPGTDLGFRLWDVKHRRQPPRPAPQAEAPADPE
jgi:hypothetical protein